MKKKLFVLITMLVGTIFNVTADDFAAQEKRVAVLPFITKGKFDPLYAEVALDNFITRLIQGKAYRVVERSQLDKAMKELKFQSGADFDESSAMEIGKLAGAEIVVIGIITALKNQIVVNIRGINVKTGIAEFAERDFIKKQEELLTSVEKIAKILSSSVESSNQAREAELTKQREMELAKQREAELARQQELELAKQREMELAKQREAELVKQREKELAKQRKKESPKRLEMQFADELEAELADFEREIELAQRKKKNASTVDFSISEEYGNVPLSQSEKKFLVKFFQQKWNIDPKDTQNVHDIYKKHIGAGAALATMGSIITVAGLAMTIAGFCYGNYCQTAWNVYADEIDRIHNSDAYWYGNHNEDELRFYEEQMDTVSSNPAFITGIVGIPVIFAVGLPMLISSSYPFGVAKHAKDIYTKITGNKSFTPRVSTTGGFYGKDRKLEIAFGCQF